MGQAHRNSGAQSKNTLGLCKGLETGYFLRSAPFRGNRQNDVDFEIYCPNPELRSIDESWSEMTPEGLAPVQEAFEIAHRESARIPIPALTVDDQISPLPDRSCRDGR